MGEKSVVVVCGVHVYAQPRTGQGKWAVVCAEGTRVVSIIFYASCLEFL